MAPWAMQREMRRVGTRVIIKKGREGKLILMLPNINIKIKTRDFLNRLFIPYGKSAQSR
jgi:hypothetical protein